MNLTFNPFSELMIFPKHIGVVADESRQLGELQTFLQGLGKGLSEEEANEAVNRIEAFMLDQLPPGTNGLEHSFTPGLYGREFYMPRGSLVVSHTHATEHQYVILSGLVSVWARETGTRVYRAPYCGVTTPGTRRVLYALEDTRWKTFHANPLELRDPEAILKYYTKPHINPLLDRVLEPSTP